MNLILIIIFILLNLIYIRLLKKDCNENLIGLAAGMALGAAMKGGSKTPASKQTLESLSESVTKVISNIELNCESNVNLSNTATLRCNVDSQLNQYRKSIDWNRMFDTCLSYVDSGFDCSSLSDMAFKSEFDCVFENIQQSNDNTTNLNCQSDTDLNANIQSEIIEQVQQDIKSEEDGAAKLLLTMIGGEGAGKDSDIKSTTKIEQIFDTNFVQDLMSSITTTNELIIEGNEGRIYAADISQTNVSMVTASLITKNSVVQQAITKIDKEFEQKQETKLKGITDIVDSLANMFGGWQALIVGAILLCLFLFKDVIMGKGNKGGKI